LSIATTSLTVSSGYYIKKYRWGGGTIACL
jgi:hypothetical protein